MSRRARFHPPSAWLAVAVLAAVATLLSTGPGPAEGTPPTPAALGRPPTGQPDVSEARTARTVTPIKHFVTLMQQNHSFDNYFGTRPGVDGIPDGTCMPVGAPPAKCITPYHLEDQPIVDLGHDQAVYEAQLQGGSLGGFVTALRGRENSSQTMGYYDDRDLPFYWNVADEYVLFDRFFSSASSGSLRNHFYWVAGAPAVAGDDRRPQGGVEELPTIFDRLEAAGVSWKFYVQNYDPAVNYRNPNPGARDSQLAWVPLLHYDRFLDDPRLSGRIVPLEEFYRDLESSSLPSVAYIVPSSASEHPPASPQLGERLVRQLITSMMRSSAWDSSAFVWTYDGWGGWYDHVVPPAVDEFGYGFRVPALLVSPYARRGHVDRTQLDFTSILRFVEDNWGLAPLAARDAAANNISAAFDFAAPARPARLLDRVRNREPVVPPRRSVVYLFYGLAMAVPVALATGVWWRGHSRRRRLVVLR